jgi:hypothetical protein
MMTYEQFDKALPTDDACKECIVVIVVTTAIEGEVEESKRRAGA